MTRTKLRHFEIASISEIELLGPISASLYFHHPVKPPEAIAYAYFVARVRNFLVDCVDELEKIVCVLRTQGKTSFTDITLLVRFRDSAPEPNHSYDFTGKFGAHPAEAVTILGLAQRAGFRVGLAFHPGSQTPDPLTYARHMRLAHEIAMQGLVLGVSGLAALNIGGGFPCPYPNASTPPIAEYFDTIRAAKLPFICEIHCEPGRALVADSVHLLARIELRKGREQRLYINDGVYGSLLELAFIDLRPPVRAHRADGSRFSCAMWHWQEFEVFGPTCDSLDRLRFPVRLPSDIATGDYLEFGLMGAYTNATQTRFNGVPRAEMLEVQRLERWWSDAS